jgi:Rnl2 family RNA ligase
MEFRSYSHMENEYRILNSKVVQEILSDNSLEFIALEKIHGTNFSFITDGIEVQCCRRSDVLQPDESFFNWQNTLNKYKSNIIKLFELVKEKLSLDIIQIQLYGELYGGNYPQVEKINGHKTIQKGIYYSNSNEFAGFDLKYFIKSDSNIENCENEDICENLELYEKYLNWDLFEQVIMEVSIGIVPVIYRGKWNDLNKLNPKFESEVYKLHGLPKIHNNWAEGFVIKPIREIYLKKDQERLIWKFKNPSFLEIVKTGNEKDKLDKEQNIHQNPLLYKLERYVCENRYDNVVVKVIEGVTVDKVVELFYLDVWVDFTDDLVLDGFVLTDIDKKECEKKLRGLANKFVRTRYLIKK